MPGLEDSADGEVISGGENTKHIDAVAIGRQGHVLHWGFAASPAYLTPSGQAALVNAIHYIVGFAGEPAYVRRNPSALTRASYDDVVYQCSEAGAAAVAAMDAEVRRVMQAQLAEIRGREAAGIELTMHEQRVLKLPPPSPLTKEMMLGPVVPQSVCDQFGEDWDAIGRYYANNRPYLYPGERRGPASCLIADPDARALGIANDSPGLIDHAVAALNENQSDARAWRILFRYTNHRFGSPAAWSAWWARARDGFFTESGGFKFMAGPEDAVPAGVAGSARHETAADAPEPDPDSPVQLTARWLPLPGEHMPEDPARLRMPVSKSPCTLPKVGTCMGRGLARAPHLRTFSSKWT